MHGTQMVIIMLLGQRQWERSDIYSRWGVSRDGRSHGDRVWGRHNDSDTEVMKKKEGVVQEKRWERQQDHQKKNRQQIPPLPLCSSSTLPFFS